MTCSELIGEIMKKITKIISLTLAIFMILVSLSACKSTKNQDTSFELTKEQLATYTIIIPSQNNENMMSVASLLQDMIEQALGINLEIKTDEVEETEFEILIGLANRTETTEFYADLKDNECGYALVGKKVLIVGNTVNTVESGLLLFKEDVLDKSDTLSVLMTADSKKITEQKEASETTNQDTGEYHADVLKGLTINALGDSYFNYSKMDKSQVWLSLLANKYSIKMNNYGIGGSTVTDRITTNNPMCQRYLSMADNNADIILLEGGRNDFNKNVKLGTVDSHDTTKFCGALNVIIEGLKEKYPNAMIVCISNWNFPETNVLELNYASYANAMEKVAKQQGVYFIRACDPEVSGIDMSSKEFRIKYCLQVSDTSHLNEEGMKIAMAHFEKILAEYYQDFLGKR